MFKCVLTILGIGEISISVQKPLKITLGIPQFLYVGDKLTIPVTLQNLSRSPMKLKFLSRASNLAEILPENAAVSLTLAAGESMVVPVDLLAKHPGKLSLQVCTCTHAFFLLTFFPC
jgi:uncharacterized protein YfaS (alpha-2-macroglobulin family)